MSSNVQLKGNNGNDPWWVIEGTPGEIAQQIAQVFPDLAINDPTLFPSLVHDARKRWAELVGEGVPQPVTGQRLVEQGLGGQVVSDSSGFTSAPSTNANPAPVAPAGGITVEEDKWGGRYELGLPNAPMTPFGQAVKKTAKAKTGKYYSRWIDPRSKAIPSVYQSGTREDPADLWEGSFA